MTTKSCTWNFRCETHERDPSMNRVAFRLDCSKARSMHVLVVTKNVRALRISIGLALRSGFDMLQGLKPSFFCAITARVNSCPDTKFNLIGSAFSKT